MGQILLGTLLSELDIDESFANWLKGNSLLFPKPMKGEEGVSYDDAFKIAFADALKKKFPDTTPEEVRRAFVIFDDTQAQLKRLKHLSSVRRTDGIWGRVFVRRSGDGRINVFSGRSTFHGLDLVEVFRPAEVREKLAHAFGIAVGLRKRVAKVA